MSLKRKLQRAVAKNILRVNQKEDLFDNILEPDSDEELDTKLAEELKSANAADAFGHNQEEEPDYDDPFYYAIEPNADKQIAFYKEMEKQQNDNENGVENGEEEEQSSSDDDNSSSDDKDGSSSEDELEHNNCATNKSINKFSSNGTDNNTTEEYDEYADGDSSDEEEVTNTIGNVPTEWYDEYDHIGYDHSGEKILKPNRGDCLDDFLRRLEDPNYSRTVIDRLTGQDVQLVDNDLELVHRLIKSQVPSSQYNMFEPFLDLYSHEVMETPLSGRPEHKRSFQPSKGDRKAVSKMVNAIKLSLIHKNTRPKRYQVHDLWKSDKEVVPMKRRLHHEYKAPPARLPNNADSYNPPPEYIPSRKQLEYLEKKGDKKINAVIMAKVPKKHSSVRAVPNHYTYFMDQYYRCLDLYMSSRFAYRKAVGKAKDLLPNLPKPRDLRPYPTKECLLYEGHRSIVRTISVHPLGKMLATGSDDHTVKIWEISTRRCLRTLEVGDAVHCVSWNPNTRVCLLAVAVGKCVVMINPETYLTDKSVVTRTNALFEKAPEQGDYIAPKRVQNKIEWVQPSAEERSQGYRIVIKHTHEVKQVVWHQEGDYFASMQPEALSSAVITHQVSRWRSQVPFSKASMTVTQISFHPKKPYFYLCCYGRIRVYSLVEKKQIRIIKAYNGSENISSIAVHPNGDHFIVGSTGNKVTWYEMENTERPFILRYHHGAIRSVAFHNKYPLFASASDDGRVIVSHGMVYSDYVKDPLLVPLKELREHQMFDGLCVLALAFHPHNPYLFTAGADSTVRMWQ